MGTRADFYIENKGVLEWLGSIAWDGYEIDNVSQATSKEEYKSLLKEFLDGRDDSTYPKDGWPWPWNNSKLTDEVYIFMEGAVWRSFDKYGCNYNDHTEPLVFVPINEFPKFNEEADEYEKPNRWKEVCLPDMTEFKSVTFGKRSGLMIISAI